MLKIHFLNVGNGDCCIIEYRESGRTVMVDINRSSEFEEGSIPEKNPDFIGLTDPVQYLKNMKIGPINTFISTHPHMDHLRGLNSIKEYLQKVLICNNDFGQKLYKLTDAQKKDWGLYLSCKDAIGGSVDGVQVLDLRTGAHDDDLSQDDITILAPSDQLLESAARKNDRNIMSTVLLIRYGNCKILLGSDAQPETWDYIVEHNAEDIKDITVFKASHHGRDGGYHTEALKIINPRYTVLSAGLEPKADVSHIYRQNFKNVYSTYNNGNIIFECNRNGNVLIDPSFI